LNHPWWYGIHHPGSIRADRLPLEGIKMRRLKKEEAKREKKSFEMFKALSKTELHFIRGGEEPNKEKGGGQ
jgi:hypothetical protein